MIIFLFASRLSFFNLFYWSLVGLLAKAILPDIINLSLWAFCRSIWAQIFVSLTHTQIERHFEWNESNDCFFASFLLFCLARNGLSRDKLIDFSFGAPCWRRATCLCVIHTSRVLTRSRAFVVCVCECERGIIRDSEQYFSASALYNGSIIADFGQWNIHIQQKMIRRIHGIKMNIAVCFPVLSSQERVSNFFGHYRQVLCIFLNGKFSVSQSTKNSCSSQNYLYAFHKSKIMPA